MTVNFANPSLYFLSVNYNSAELLEKLLCSLGPNQGVVVVNNSPEDAKVQGFAGDIYGGGEVVVLDAAENLGFGAGCNIGLRWVYARSPDALVWLINPDAQLLSAATASVRQGLIDQPNIAILGTPILDDKGSLWFGSGRFNRWTGAVSAQCDAVDASTPLSAPVLTQWVSGCSMVLNLAVLDHCPQFDETYFLYYEDCDLCRRYLQQGQRVAIMPQPLVVHAVSSITSRNTQSKYAHATFSKLIFLHRYATSLALGLNLIYLFGQSLGHRDRDAAQGRWIGIKRFVKLFIKGLSKANAITMPAMPQPSHTDAR
ncbi:MAG: glycosyltransferase family 2 protein [Phormidesmis sp.]